MRGLLPHQPCHIPNQPVHHPAKLNDGGFLYLQESLIFGHVPLLVSSIQYPPAWRWPVQGVRQGLKHGDAVLAAVAMPSQGGQGRGVRGVVGADEAAFERDVCLPRIGQPATGHRQHAFDLGLVAWLGLELADAHQVIQRGKAHGVLRSVGGRAAPGRD